MPHVVYVDRGDHFEIISDYSRSPRHASLNEGEWKSEFANSPSYEGMRKTQNSPVAAIAPKSGGKWKKDWSGPYVPPLVRLLLISDAAIDFDGVPVVEAGSQKHKVTVQKEDQDGKHIACGGESVRILVSWPILLSTANPSLVGGKTVIEIGPCDTPCDLVVSAADPEGVIQKGTLTVRFK